MAAPKNFVTGFNHNIKHKGQVFHVQTEDSGVENAAITTHLFVGGTILATLRCSYADWLAAPDLAQRVRARMEEQHKEMLRNLVNGKYDDVGHGPSYQPGQIEVQRQANMPPASTQGVRPEVNPHATAAAAPVRPPAAQPGRPQPVAPGTPVARAPAPRATPVPTGWTSGAALRANPAGGTTPGPSARRTPGPAPAPAASPPAATPAKPFGDDLITDRSLDQVILAWLAGEDRQG